MSTFAPAALRLPPEIPGTAFFDHSDSFAMIRGGHIDLAIMGAYQAAENGDIAHWKAGDEAVTAVAARWIW